MHDSKPRVLALVQLPPPRHGLSLKNQRMLRGRLNEKYVFLVVPLDFNTSLGTIGQFSVRKVGILLKVVFRLVYYLSFRAPELGYLTMAGKSPAVHRDCLLLSIFRLFRVPYVVHLPGMGIVHTRATSGRLGRSLIGGSLREARSIICLGPTQAAAVQEAWGTSATVVVANGVDDAAGPEIRQRWKQPQTHGCNTVLFLSNLMPEKGTHFLLRAASRIRSDLRVRLVFCGAWPSETSETEFWDEASALGIRDSVSVLGFVTGRAKNELFLRARAFVLPTQYREEGTPNSIIEAMSFAVPIVSTFHAGIPDLVVDAQSALLVGCGEIDSLASAIERVLTDQGLAKRLGLNARDRFETYFTIGAWENRMDAVISDALS